MVDYARVSVRTTVSENSDYSSPHVDSGNHPKALTTNKAAKYDIGTTTSPFTIELNPFASINSIVVRNKATAAAQIVDVTWHHVKGTHVAGDLILTTSGDLCLIERSGASDFDDEGASAGCWVRLTSTGTAANNGLALVTAVAADYIVVYRTTPLFSDGADATLSLQFERKNTQGVAAGGFLVLTDSIYPGADLIVESESGAPELEIIITGS